jgi:hypothetical protein
MDFAQAADADGLAEVDVSGYGGGADVEPISFRTCKISLILVCSERFWDAD